MGQNDKKAVPVRRDLQSTSSITSTGTISTGSGNKTKKDHPDSSSPITFKKRRPNVPCACDNCQKDDCKVCVNCKGKRKYGGDGKNHQRCVQRTCLVFNYIRKPKERELLEKEILARKKARQEGTRDATLEEEEEEEEEGGNDEEAEEEQQQTNPEKDEETESTRRSWRRAARRSEIEKLEEETSHDNTIEESGERRLRTKSRKSKEMVPDNTTSSKESDHSVSERFPPRIRKQIIDTFSEENRAKSKRMRCKKCPACMHPECGKCKHCLGKVRWGGTGKDHDPCVKRRCHVLYPEGRRMDYGPFRRPRQEGDLPKESSSIGRNSRATSSRKRSRAIADDDNNNSESDTNSHRSGYTRSKKQRNSDNSVNDSEKQNSLSNNNENRRTQCGKCIGCQSEDCGLCTRCLGKKKFGGDGRNREVCLIRKCHVLYPKQKEWLSNYLKENPEVNAALKKRKKRNEQEERKRKKEQDDRETSKRKASHRQHQPAQAQRKKPPPNNIASSTFENNGTEPFGSVEVRSRNSADRKKEPVHESPCVTRKRPPAAALNVGVPKQHSILTDLVDTYGGIKQDQNHAVTTAAEAAAPVEAMEYLYGIPIPSDPGSDTCAGCRGANDDATISEPLGISEAKFAKTTNDDTENGIYNVHHDGEDGSNATPIVLLCDGPGCGREYHLGCCTPALSSVPEKDHWLCEDCCPDNTTSPLREYLEQADEAKAEFFHELEEEEDKAGMKPSTYIGDNQVVSSFVLHLLQRECVEIGLPADSDMPMSELDRASKTHSLALKYPQEAKSSHNTKAPIVTEKLPPDAFLGKPIRMYISTGNQYHTGRIVDYRPLNSKRGSRNGSTSSFFRKRTHSDDIHKTEFLVRFAAGKDDRKSTYYHWLVLEEHSLAVGLSFVWARMQHNSPDWKPAILWYRTARELIPVQHMYDRKKGEIFFRKRTDFSILDSPITEEDGSSRKKSKKKQKKRVWALARTFGREEYALIDVKSQAVDFTDPSAIELYKNKSTTLQFEVAESERKEQERVRHWRTLEQRNPVGPKVLSSRDWYSLPSLIPQRNYLPDINVKRHAALCPNIPLGIDRSLVLGLLKNQGVEQSKDVASSLICDLIPLNAKTFAEARKQHQRSQQDSQGNEKV